MQRQAERWLARADVVVRCTPVGERPLALATTAPLVEVVTMSDLVTTNDELAATHGRAPGEGAHAERHGSTSSVAAAHAASIATSARTGEGVERLREALREAVRADHALRGAQLASILPRHAESLAAAAAALDEAAAHARRATRSALDAPEVVASLLRGALDALGEVAAPVHPDEVLGLVFSRFCIGK
jgi:tRNA U34 5-carboxymethylaminomethyl modifying GTPase MnmE/TrmE